MPKRVRAALRWLFDSYVLFIVIGLILGGAIAPIAMQTTGGPDGTIAVIRVDGTINGNQAAAYSQLMRQAREEADAVVIIANSGGGSSVASEEMYLQTKRTADEIPVVVSVDAAAASGAYFTVVPADQIYVKPSSIVGSIGVLATPPPQVEPTEIVATTGPDKLTGGSGRAFFYSLESVQRAFLNAVFDQRGDRISVSRSRIERASTFVGVRAVELGLADGIGDRQRAVQQAAELAELEQPRVVVYGPQGGQRSYLTRGTYLASEYEDKRMTDLAPMFQDSDGLPTFLMVPESVVDPERTVIPARALDDGSAASTTNATSSEGSTNGTEPTPESDTDANRTAGAIRVVGGR